MVGVKTTKYRSPQEFLEQMDSGAIYRDYARQLRQLSPEQRTEVDRLLAERAERQVNANTGWYVNFCSSLIPTPYEEKDCLQDHWPIENPIVK
jgi:hypothetical protein